MQVHELKSNNQRTKKRVGRGGKRGTTSGRGTKGQKARSGRRIRPMLRDILKKLPKKRGYRVRVLAPGIAVVNIREIERVFDSNAEVSPKTLQEKGLISRASGKLPFVKILGTGEAKKQFVFKGCNFSRSAKEAVEKSGSRILAQK